MTVKEYRELQKTKDNFGDTPEIDPKELQEVMSKPTAIFVRKKKPENDSKDPSKIQK